MAVILTHGFLQVALLLRCQFNTVAIALYSLHLLDVARLPALVDIAKEKREELLRHRAIVQRCLNFTSLLFGAISYRGILKKKSGLADKELITKCAVPRSMFYKYKKIHAKKAHLL